MVIVWVIRRDYTCYIDNWLLEEVTRTCVEPMMMDYIMHDTLSSHVWIFIFFLRRHRSYARGPYCSKIIVIGRHQIFADNNKKKN